MGFFDLKATCGVCDQQVELNRFKLKKSNAWICPSCLKEAGGATRINVNKVTVEEVKAIIQEKEDKLGDDPMSRAENMYQYCVDNQFGSGFNQSWGVKHFKVLQDNLIRDEKVLMTFIGLHNYNSVTKHDSNYAYAITNKRILFGQKSMTGEKFKAVNHERINDISFEKGMVFGVLTIDTPQEKFKVGLDSGSATAINNAIHEILDKLKTSNKNDHTSVPVPISNAEEIIKYKELLDAGIITPEEFEAKKKQLLGL
ncbi:PH domain-containing protein [Solibacillus sp. A46]|uniref:PH domain-containing protein n=1 Tax=Solibacillus faecavium TaxID=2762221 RepID=A0ABR8XXS3_9BACL|nr:PH domain-containing protein [Solibacillus faecavium]MBD8036747.1 PH domain-containing protein [Solibacillus faecavium]